MKKIKQTIKSDKVHEELETVKSMLVRALADYENLSKRVERERMELGKMASLNVLSNLLPTLDMFEKAQNHLKDSGLAIGITEFKKVLGEEGLTEILPKVGDEFNHETMEAIEVTKGEEDNIISEVVLPGWKFSDGQVVRYAKVIVSKK